MFFCALLVIFCCVSVIKSETCYGKHEKSIISGIRSSLKTLENRLNEKSPRCRAGWKEYKNHCYYFSSDKMTWFEAERKCRNIGAYLVKITDSSENSWIKNMITSKKVVEQSYWMGAADYLKEGDWRWVSDLSKVQYSGWKSGEPNNSGSNEDCAHFYQPHGFNWNDGSKCLPYAKV
ncbi:perlucin-like protein isoform X2 [Mytilus californianus]|uniref:perlucin-like protein isoform X2 n=1 Tax=Mytilus californianus TaxID=6549 RepID=UPI00224754E0|nr:perlucin-like protein isoform X2 [Mytilus californianus]